MRIVAGEYRGRVIDSPPEKTTRPTTDRVRESMFSAIYSRIGDLQQIAVLDAFCGSGALGLEALSRGAASCVSFERDRAAQRVIEANVKSLAVPANRYCLVKGDVIQASRRPIARFGPFGLVLLDPPYALEAGEVRDLLGRLADNGDLSDGCVVAYEHAYEDSASAEALFDEDNLFAVTGVKKYGKIGVLFMEKKSRLGNGDAHV